MHIYTLILIHLSLSNWAIWHTVINNELADRYFDVGYLSWVIYLCSALCTLKIKNLKKPLKNFKNLKTYLQNPKNLGFFQPCRRSKTKPDDSGCESDCTGCQKLHPPSPFIVITQPES